MTVPLWEERRSDLAALHAAALKAADPASAVRRALSIEGDRLLGDAPHVRIVALGKASIAMARGACDVLGRRVAAGVVAHPSGLPPGGDWPVGIRFIAAGHPLPDPASLAAGAAALDLLRETHPGDVVLALVSGGGSALFEVLRDGITLEEIRGIISALSLSGADILEINTVRRALSRVKGGGLLRAAGDARVVTLALSDVIGDPPDGIASGPTVFSSTTDEDALVVLARRGLAERFPRAIEVLGRAGPCERALTPGAPSPYLIVGSNRLSVDAICAEATGRGFEVNAPIPPLAGEAREAGRHLGGLARQIRERGWPLGPPACVVVGGENTVHVRGNGRGGRCQELALAAALALDGCLRATLLAFATDGIDGPTDAAGAVVTGETVARARGLGLCAEAYLDDNDAWTFFRTLEDLWVTGPTGTNVNDLAILLVYP